MQLSMAWFERVISSIILWSIHMQSEWRIVLCLSVVSFFLTALVTTASAADPESNQPLDCTSCHQKTLEYHDKLGSDNNACIACEEIIELQFPEVEITEATIISEKTSYCKVLGTIGKEINFELLLPGDWNGRFFMGGGGGFVGSIANGARWSVHDGYATSGTDTGHKGNGLKADWALDNMERQINFGHLAIHRTALVSKAIIAKYYCHDPEYLPAYIFPPF